LPRFYSKYLKATLQEAVEECLTQSPHDQVSVFEELALMRLTVEDAIKLWDKSRESSALATRMEAGMILRDQLKEVSALADQANRIMLAGKDQYSVHTLVHVVNQLVRIAYDVFADHRDLAEEFERQIRERVKLPTEGQGTASTPDMDVADMDNTVPLEEGS
jgi:hypothetical protein